MKTFRRSRPIFLFSFLLFSILLSACGGGPTPTAPSSTSIITTTSEEDPPSVDETSDVTEPSVDESSDEPVVNQDFIGVTFKDKTVVYTGTEHILDEVTNAPEGTQVTYTNRLNYINVGTYAASAKLTKEGYNELVLNASLIITPATFSNIEFSDMSVEYDAKPHKILITGSLPTGTTVTYQEVGGEGTNEFTEPGTYEVEATLKNANFNDLVLRATLTITAVLDDLYSYYSSTGNFYFQNALHKDYLYKYKDDAVVKVNSDKPQFFSEGADIYYISNSLLSNSIMRYKEATNERERLSDISAAELVGDGNALYFIEKKILGQENIYKLNLASIETPPILLYSGKAKSLQYMDNYLYFIGENNLLYRINTLTFTNAPAPLMPEVKVKNLVASGGVLYFTENHLLGDYLSKYTVSSGVKVKLTSDAAGNMIIIGTDLYYTNIDKLNTLMFGKGIYKVSTLLTIDNNGSGTKVLSDEMEQYELTSLQSDGTNIYFYRVYDKNVYRYNPASGELTNLLEGFVVPEEVISGRNGVSAKYGNVIYYQNNYDSGKLYAYDTLNNTNTRVTSGSIDDLYIYGDELYYREVAFFLFKKLYKINLKVNEPPVLVKDVDAGNLHIYQDKIYYVNYKGGNTLNRMNLDGTNDEVLYDKEVYNLRAKNNRLYFIQNSLIYGHGWVQTINITAGNTDYTLTQLDNVRTSNFEIVDNNIYFRRLYGFGYLSKDFSSTDLDGNNLVTLVADVDPLYFEVTPSHLYFFDDVGGKEALVMFNRSTKVITTLTTGFASNIRYHSGHLYYFNYRAGMGDSHFYKVNIASLEKTRVDTI